MIKIIGNNDGKGGRNETNKIGTKQRVSRIIAVNDELPVMVKLLDPEDLEVFKRIRLEALRNEPAAFASRIEDWASLSHEEWVHRITGSSVFVTFLNNKPVGIMGLMWQQSSKMAHRATIVMVYVRESVRGSGLATGLLQTLIEYASAAGIKQLELAVNAENAAAIRFYNREGFTEIGRIPSGFIHEGQEIDEIMMARRISQ